MKNIKWYHFWNPQSGFVGGLIFSAVLFGLVVLLHNLYILFF